MEKRWRAPASPRGQSIRGLVLRDPKTRTLYLVTTDLRERITRLSIVSDYVTPRHTRGTRMVAYRAIIDGRRWMGRASGRMLILRRVPSEK